MIIISHDYKVVINIHKVIIQQNEVELLCNDRNKQESLISDSVVEIRTILTLQG
jgi:hypothetical protein